jgi:hypothetical protein
VVTPEWLNAVQGELVALVEAAGLLLNKNNNQQVSEALAVLSRQQKYAAFTTTGAAPTFTVADALGITAYAEGLRLRLKFNAAGNGADTININVLGAKSLKQYDAAGTKVAAVIAANQLVDVEYDGVDFVLLDPLPNVKGLGDAQTWKGASRSSGVTYTNTTGMPIALAIHVTNPLTGIVQLYVQGEVVDGYEYNVTTGGRFVLKGIVPVGATYSVVTNGGSIQSWRELK